MNDKKRFFLGITLPDKLTADIERIQAKLHDDRATLKPIIPHITLLPPNSLAHIPLDELVTSCEQIASTAPPPSVVLEEVDAFSSRRVVFIRVHSRQLPHLHAELVKVVRPVMVPHMGRNYTPHVTLLQKLRKTHGQFTPTQLKSMISAFESGLSLPDGFTANQLVIFEQVTVRNYRVANQIPFA